MCFDQSPGTDGDSRGGIPADNIDEGQPGQERSCGIDAKELIFGGAIHHESPRYSGNKGERGHWQPN